MTDALMNFGFERSQAVKTTICINSVFFATQLLCTLIIERAGRRILLLVGQIGMTLTLLLLSFLPILLVIINTFLSCKMKCILTINDLLKPKANDLSKIFIFLSMVWFGVFSSSIGPGTVTLVQKLI